MERSPKTPHLIRKVQKIMMRRGHLLFQGDSKDVVGSLAAAIAQMPQATVSTPTTVPSSHVSGRVSASQSYLPFDPLGGMDHRDYIRDVGGVPHYAPRNVTDGGRFSFQHAGSPLSAHLFAPLTLPTFRTSPVVSERCLVQAMIWTLGLQLPPKPW